ncbi:MAG TPA: hypothetical protein VNP92_25310 [Actinophytocola sp.]|nr:hypothetical protein [Actinophytocola sp.]
MADASGSERVTGVAEERLLVAAVLAVWFQAHRNGSTAFPPLTRSPG